MAQLNVENISLGYEGNIIAKDISFCVNSGDYLYIIGENGAGKSTLLKALLNLHKPLNGVIMLSEGIKRNQVGYLPQQKDVQKDFPASVTEIVLSGFINSCGLRPFYSKREKAVAAENMEKLGITPLAKRCYRELSGGQQQRVLLARALCSANKIILLDEPVAGLDPAATEEMYKIIKGLNQDDGMTVVMVSHDIKAALKYATHILKIEKRTYFFGTKDDYLANGQNGGESYANI